MKTLKAFFLSKSHFASAVCFAGFYVVSLTTVFSMIKGTQVLLGLI